MPTDETAPQEIDVKTAAEWLRDGTAVLVDVRETIEHQQERIAGAKIVPLSTLKPDDFVDFRETRLVLHCAVGQRSMLAGQFLMQCGVPRPYNMSGGIEAWKEAGLPVETGILE